MEKSIPVIAVNGKKANMSNHPIDQSYLQGEVFDDEDKVCLQDTRGLNSNLAHRKLLRTRAGYLGESPNSGETKRGDVSEKRISSRMNIDRDADIMLKYKGKPLPQRKTDGKAEPPKQRSPLGGSVAREEQNIQGSNKFNKEPQQRPLPRPLTPAADSNLLSVPSQSGTNSDFRAFSDPPLRRTPAKQLPHSTFATDSHVAKQFLEELLSEGNAKAENVEEKKRFMCLQQEILEMQHEKQRLTTILSTLAAFLDRSTPETLNSTHERGIIDLRKQVKAHIPQHFVYRE